MYGALTYGYSSACSRVWPGLPSWPVPLLPVLHEEQQYLLLAADHPVHPYFGLFCVQAAL